MATADRCKAGLVRPPVGALNPPRGAGLMGVLAMHSWRTHLGVSSPLADPLPFTQVRFLEHLLWARYESRHLGSKSKPSNKLPEHLDPGWGDK